MADAAWALFGDDEGQDVAGPDKKAPPPLRASAHPFFEATRECWSLEPSDDARSPSLSKEAMRASLNLEGRVPALAASLRGRDMHDPADALSGLVETPTAERASDVIAACVQALASASTDDIAASRLNAAILLARAVKADRALDAANEATPRAGDEGRPPDAGAAAAARRLAMAAAEAAVLLAECALLVDDPEPTTATAATAGGGAVANAPKANRRWIGARVVAASAAAARAERAHRRALDGPDAERLRPPPRALSTTTDDAMRAVIARLRRVAESERMTHWDDADRVDRASVSAASFYNAFVRPNRPAILKGALARDAWRATETFADLRWLGETYGDTPVPVEVGSRSGRPARDGVRDVRDDRDDRDDAPRYATLRAFLETYFAETTETETTAETTGRARADDEGGPVAYVAQHSLLHQVPGLQEHFAVPDLCLGRLRAANAWLGTANTTTHLHTDDAENVLCQVAGHKLVRLFPPSCDALVYKKRAGKGNGSVNAFSPIDCENVDDDAFPAFAEAREKGVQVVVGPGEALFVPRGWWHYARALEPSFSVNFWF